MLTVFPLDPLSVTCMPRIFLSSPHRPDVVVFPINKDEVSSIMRFAHDRGISVVAYGQGTGVEGHIIPLQGGITMDFAQMSRIVAIRPNDFVVQVEPGITRTALNRALGPYGLFFLLIRGPMRRWGHGGYQRGWYRSIALRCDAATGFGA